MAITKYIVDEMKHIAKPIDVKELVSILGKYMDGNGLGL